MQLLLRDIWILLACQMVSSYDGLCKRIKVSWLDVCVPACGDGAFPFGGKGTNVSPRAFLTLKTTLSDINYVQ